VYWIPLFQILEERGFKVYLVNAHYLKSVPRTQEPRIRQPVDTVSALGRVAAGELPAIRRDLCPSYPVAAPWQPAVGGCRAHSANAEGA